MQTSISWLDGDIPDTSWHYLDHWDTEIVARIGAGGSQFSWSLGEVGDGFGLRQKTKCYSIDSCRMVPFLVFGTLQNASECLVVALPHSCTSRKKSQELGLKSFKNLKWKYKIGSQPRLQHTMGNGKTSGLMILDNLVSLILIWLEQHLCYFAGSFQG